MNGSIRILILSAHGVFRECLGSALAESGELELERCGCMESCRRSFATGEPQVLLVDVAYPVAGQLDWLRGLESGRTSRLVLLGVDPSPDSVGTCYLEVGADASLPLDAPLSTLTDTIRRVLAGEKIYPPSIAYLLYRHLAQKSLELDLRRRLSALALTRREMEILGLLAESCTNETIATRLGISIHTVKNHVHNILDKLQVDNRASAAELASRQGWLQSAERYSGGTVSGIL